jgi:nitrite reductase/ring-hydroxylating ferredoxin subunit
METKAQKGEQDQARGVKAATGPRKVRIGRADSLPERGRLVVDIDATLTVGVFRLDDQLFAYENTCAHSGGPVCQGRILPRVIEVIDSAKKIHGQNWDESDMHIVCPWHGFEYSIKTGQHAGDASIRLRSFPVHEADGDIYVEV